MIEYIVKYTDHFTDDGTENVKSLIVRSVSIIETEFSSHGSPHYITLKASNETVLFRMPWRNIVYLGAKNSIEES